MRTNILDHADAKTVGATCGARIKLTWPAFALVVTFAALGTAGCQGYHSGSPGYRPYYGGDDGYFGSGTIATRPPYYPPGVRRSF